MANIPRQSVPYRFDAFCKKVLRHHDRYIKKLCTRKLYDDCGQEHYCVDEYMKRHLEIKLITAIVNMKLD